MRKLIATLLCCSSICNALPVVTAKGTAATKVLGTTLSIASVSLNAGDTLVVSFAFGTAGVSVTSITWGSLTLTQDNLQTGTNIITGIYSGRVVTGGTNSITITTSVAAGVIALAASSITNLASNYRDTKPTGASGSSTTPADTAAFTTQGAEVLYGNIATNGPVEDADGSWSNSWTVGQTTGTTGGVAISNGKISEGYKIVFTRENAQAAKTGITSRSWAASHATYVEQGSAPFGFSF